MRGGQFSFVRTRTDNDAIESGNAARLLPRRSCMKLASGRRMAPENPYDRTGWRQGLGAGVRRNVAASGSVAAGRRCRNSRPAARPAVAMAAGGAGARAIDPLGADRVRRRHRMLFRRGSRAARVGRSIGRDWRGSGCLCGAPASIRFSARRWHRRCICGTRHCNTADRHIGRLYRPWCLPNSHRSLAGRRSLGSRRAILRTPLRWSGAFVATGAIAWALATPQPDILVAGDGQTAAFRGKDGRLAVLRAGRDTFAIKEWLAADADARTPKDGSLGNGVTCDAVGCIGRLGDSRLVSIVVGIEAFAEDCARAAVVFSDRESPADCNAMLVDRAIWQSYGAVALRWTGDRFTQTVALPRSQDRP